MDAVQLKQGVFLLYPCHAIHVGNISTNMCPMWRVHAGVVLPTIVWDWYPTGGSQPFYILLFEGKDLKRFVSCWLLFESVFTK